MIPYPTQPRGTDLGALVVLFQKGKHYFFKPCFVYINFQDIKSKWGEVKTLVPQRDQTLSDELRKQQNNEQLRRQFAEKANQVGPWIERQMDAVAAIGLGMQVRIILGSNLTMGQ